MPPTEDNVSLTKEKKVGYSIAGSLSLFFHLGLFLLIGGTVIIEQIIPKQAMTGDVTESVVAPPVEEMPEDPAPDTPQSNETEQVPPAATEASPFDITTVTMDTPSATYSVPVGTVVAMPGVPGASAGAGGANGITGTAKKLISIFGTKTESAKLGIILDCSGSAQGFLLAAFKEIDKTFERPPTVLTVGCGMANVPDAKVELYRSLKADKEKDKAGTRTILGQLAMAEEKYKDLGKYLNNLKRRDNVWATYGGDINGTAVGFEYLIQQGVDTIYWFSDLKDAVDPKIFADLTAELKSKGIKVIVHNFSGEAIPERQGKMATETGGSTISRKP